MNPPPATDDRSHDRVPLDEKRAMIALSLIPGVGPGRIRLLLEKFRTARNILEGGLPQMASIAGIGEQTALSIAGFDQEDEVDRQLARAEALGAEMITQNDERYPAILKEIHDPPYFLWSLGTMPPRSDQDQAVAVVGTRKATSYGLRVARELAEELARRGFTIISGLAYGIDAAAHRGALSVGGRTIAVLGSGVDRIYPGKHARMAREMLDQGAILSEYPMGEKPDAPNFPRRNRLISGLAQGTVVVEAYDRGGALITASLAVQQNREVFAVPGPIYSRASAGTNDLIRAGATLVRSADDIIAELGFASAGHGSGALDGVQLELELEPEELALCRVLNHEPIYIDQICAESGLDSAAALVYLLQLEFKGIVRQLAGKQFYLDRPVAGLP